MVRKMIRAATLTLAVLVLSLMAAPTVAQSDSSQLWGIWKTPNVTLAFYADTFLYLPFESSGTGAYQVSGDTITFNGTLIYADSVPLVETVHFSIVGNTLYLPDITFGDKQYERWSMYSPDPTLQCEGSVPTQMKVGYVGQVTVTADHKPTNLRRSPTVGAEKMASLHDGLYFAVVDGPVCADGFEWFKIRPLYEYEGYIGWAAEGGPVNGVVRYFIAPAEQTLEALNYVNTTPSASNVTYPCGGTLQTNLFNGAPARVAFLSGYSPLQAYSEPSQTGQDAGRISEGELILVVEGPRCRDGAIWWKVSDNMGTPYGWVPEVTGSNFQFVERVTTDPNDKTAKYDVLLGASPINNHVMFQVPYKLYQNANTAVLVGGVQPNIAYEIVGTNADISMIQIAVSGQHFWACSSDNYQVFAQRLLPNAIPITDPGTYQCKDTDRLFTAEELFIQAGATVYPPGQYPHQADLATALENEKMPELAGSLSGLAEFVKPVPHTDTEMVCALVSGVGVMSAATKSKDKFLTTAADTVCLVYDVVKAKLTGEPIAGVAFFMAALVADHEHTLDPKSDWVNERVDKGIFTRLYCHYNPDVCVNGPGSGK